MFSLSEMFTSQNTCPVLLAPPQLQKQFVPLGLGNGWGQEWQKLLGLCALQICCLRKNSTDLLLQSWQNSRILTLGCLSSTVQTTWTVQLQDFFPRPFCQEVCKYMQQLPYRSQKPSLAASPSVTPGGLPPVLRWRQSGDSLQARFALRPACSAIWLLDWDRLRQVFHIEHKTCTVTCSQLGIPGLSEAAKAAIPQDWAVAAKRYQLMRLWTCYWSGCDSKSLFTRASDLTKAITCWTPRSTSQRLRNCASDPTSIFNYCQVPKIIDTSLYMHYTRGPWLRETTPILHMIKDDAFFLSVWTKALTAMGTRLVYGCSHRSQKNFCNPDHKCCILLWSRMTHGATILSLVSIESMVHFGIMLTTEAHQHGDFS